jgi:hypothetical protein
MFYLLFLVVAAIAIKRKVPLNHSIIIDRLPGAAISANLTLHGDAFRDRPCWAARSSIAFKNRQDLVLLGQFSNEQFEQHFNNGRFSGQWPSLVAMVRI